MEVVLLKSHHSLLSFTHPLHSSNPTSFWKRRRRSIISYQNLDGLLSLPAYKTSSSCRYSSRGRYTQHDDDDGEEEEPCSFEEAVQLFNKMEYYKCHDVLESLWHNSQDPARTLLHGILQCAVAFYHLSNQNHKGAMMELGEGLCKLRKMNFENGPFWQFEEEISAVLDFIHQTQLELAACTEELCLAMDQSEKSYQLLGSYGAGQVIYRVEKHHDQLAYIIFSPDIFQGEGKIPSRSVKLPFLLASENHLTEFQSTN